MGEMTQCPNMGRPGRWGIASHHKNECGGSQSKNPGSRPLEIALSMAFARRKSFEYRGFFRDIFRNRRHASPIDISGSVLRFGLALGRRALETNGRIQSELGLAIVESKSGTPEKSRRGKARTGCATICPSVPGFRNSWFPASFFRRMTHGPSPETGYGASFPKSPRVCSPARGSPETGTMHPGASKLAHPVNGAHVRRLRWARCRYVGFSLLRGEAFDSQMAFSGIKNSTKSEPLV
ncbi:hypothetical protein SCOR_32710 [Sulfidibacter corallicola]